MISSYLLCVSFHTTIEDCQLLIRLVVFLSNKTFEIIILTSEKQIVQQEYKSLNSSIAIEQLSVIACFVVKK